MKALLGLGVVALLAGCASPTTVSDAARVPADRVLAYQDKSQGRDAVITVLRDWSYSGSGCFFAVLVDGKLSARIDTSEKVSFYVKPGRRIVGVSIDPHGNGLCSAGNINREVATLIEAGETQLFRVAADLDAGMDIRASSF